MLRSSLVGVIACLVASLNTVWAQAPASKTPKAVPGPFKVTAIATGLDHPWGLELLPDGRLLITERSGHLRIVGQDGQVSEPLHGLPKIEVQGQGGLLDVTLSPQFAQDRLVYFSFSEPGNGGAGTSVARGRLGENALENVQVIWRQMPKVNSSNHWGSRLVFRKDGTLFVTLGDRYNQRQKAQDLGATIGKIVRINPDGSTPPDNPFVNRNGARGEIWSYGHRNVQAATLHPQTQDLWTVEHGARGGDELNQPQAGKHYGWPIITYGIDYSGEKIGEGTAKPGMVQPIFYWDPVIAPSGAAFYTGTAFKDWNGNLLVGSLKPGGLVRLELKDGQVAGETRYADTGLNARIRDIQVDDKGLIYVLTDSANGRILRLEPKQGGTPQPPTVR